MRSYHVDCGVMGYIPALDRYMLFATDSDYEVYFRSCEGSD